MRRIIINGAVFMFLTRGQKLTESDALPSNGVPDKRYVLWPCGDQWDVLYLARGSDGHKWQPISDRLFPDEGSAWRAAFDYQCERDEAEQRKYCIKAAELSHASKFNQAINGWVNA